MQRSNYAFRNELESLMRADGGSSSPDCDGSSVDLTFGDKNRDSPSFCSSVSGIGGGSMNEARLRGGVFTPNTPPLMSPPRSEVANDRRRRNLSWTYEDEARDSFFAREGCRVSVYDEHGRRVGGQQQQGGASPSPSQALPPPPGYNVYHTWRGPPLHPMPPIFHHHQPAFLCVEEGSRPAVAHHHRRSFSHVLVPQLHHHPGAPSPHHVPTMNVSVPYSPMLSVSTPTLSLGPFPGPMSPRVPALPVIKKDFDVWAYDRAHDSRMSDKYGHYVDV